MPPGKGIKPHKRKTWRGAQPRHLKKGEIKMDMNERLIKAQEALAKLEKTLERHTIRHNKLVEMKRTGKLSKKYRESPNSEFWLDGDIEWSEEDIQTTIKKIEARKKQIAELTATIKKKEQEVAEFPEILKKLQKELETRWNQYDRKNGETGTEKQNCRSKLRVRFNAACEGKGWNRNRLQRNHFKRPRPQWNGEGNERNRNRRNDLGRWMEHSEVAHQNSGEIRTNRTKK